MEKAKIYFLLLGMFCFFGTAVAQEDETGQPVSEFMEENQQCLQCHGQSHYTYYNEAAGKELKEFMCPNRRIDSAAFYSSFHKTFSCFDCHSGDYTTFPHPVELRAEEPWSCTDCHAYDEEYAHFHFEEIAAEYDSSVHAEVEGFSCWDCHDPHSYRTVTRNNESIKNIVAYANGICLSCHADFDEFQLLTSRDEIDIMATHDWLPRQDQHFSSVRCIECHAQQNDSILVAHQIMSAEHAVDNCVDCHSKNSILMASLYKHQVSESRSKYGFLNGEILADYYVIGANRNVVLNIISIIIFGMVILGIVVHFILRVKSKKAN